MEESSAKVVDFVETNNSDQIRRIERPRRTLDETEPVQWIGLDEEWVPTLDDQLQSFFGSLFWHSLIRTRLVGLPDKMFSDLRKSGCLLPPRRQSRECGSCYAFAAMAMMEYHYCKITGKRVALSGQYMIDCGYGRFRGLNGCEGAAVAGAPDFIHNFGLELRINYPLSPKLGECPYKQNMGLERTGYIRMPIEKAALLFPNKWADVLPHGPLYVSFAAGLDFDDYGGVVYDGRGCDTGQEADNHAIGLVGHGCQDGEQFWLLP